MTIGSLSSEGSILNRNLHEKIWRGHIDSQYSPKLIFSLKIIRLVCKFFNQLNTTKKINFFAYNKSHLSIIDFDVRRVMSGIINDCAVYKDSVCQ